MNFGLEKLIEKYSGLWVAFKPETTKVIAVSKDAKKALKYAKAKGVNIPILFKVPTELTPFVG